MLYQNRQHDACPAYALAFSYYTRYKDGSSLTSQFRRDLSGHPRNRRPSWKIPLLFLSPSLLLGSCMDIQPDSTHLPSRKRIQCPSGSLWPSSLCSALYTTTSYLEHRGFWYNASCLSVFQVWRELLSSYSAKKMRNSPATD